MVCVILGSGFEESEALVPADLLRRAGVDVSLVSLHGQEVTGGHGVTVKADMELSQGDPNAVELLFLPGGLGGVEAISNCLEALEFIRIVSTKGRYVAAICAAPTILAALGLLDGRKAVCYPGMEDQMAGALMQKGAPVVIDGTLITGEAAGSALPFGLKLVELLKGSDAEKLLRNSIYYRG